MQIRVRAFRADGQWYRSWATALVSQSPYGLVTLSEPGGSVATPIGNWVSPYRIQAYYWFERPYNLLEVYAADGALQELYVNIASPARWVSGDLHFTDHELDLIQPAGGAMTIVDQDEFAAARLAYGYSDAFVAACHAACRRAERLLARWRLGLPPDVAIATDDS